MEKETLFIAFSTQKGGAGKTTLTVLVASYLHYVKGMNVAVVDCDYPQHSIAEMRKRDLKTVMEDEHYKLMAYRQLQRIRKKAYPIAESTAEDAVAKADELLEKMPETDIVFFDLPGTVNSTGVLNTLANMDYVFSPIAADRVVMESTLRFASRLNDTLIAGQDEYQRSVPSVEHGGRPGEIGTVQGVRTGDRRAGTESAEYLPAGQQTVPP